MINADTLQRLTQEISSRLSAAGHSATGSAAVKRLVQEAVSQLDLVTREDYERLLQIHQRTRSRVDELAKRVEQLEANLPSEPR